MWTLRAIKLLAAAVILLFRDARLFSMATIDEGSALLSALEESIGPDPDIVFVVAFGSRVTDGQRRSSDLDLAIKFDDELSAHTRFQKRCFLSGDLQRSNAPFIDLSDIEILPIEVAHDAVNGQLICGDEAAFHSFKSDVEKAFDVKREDIRRQQRAVIDRIAAEGLSW